MSNYLFSLDPFFFKFFIAILSIGTEVTENEDHFSVNYSEIKNAIRTFKKKAEVACWQSRGQKQLASWLLACTVFKIFFN